MAPPSKSAPTIKWIIDLHGIKEALASRSNARTRIIDAIQRGEMVVMRSVQDDLKIFDYLWTDFCAIKPKKYVDTPVSVTAMAATMQEANGSSLLGGVPSFAHFEALALARNKKCKLVTAGKGFADCQSIAKKCKLPATDVVSIGDV
jgi:hypothetical protein